MDSEQFISAGSTAMDQIAQYYDSIEERPVISKVQPGYLKQLLPEAAPQDGEAWDDIQKDIELKIMPGLTHWQSPNFMAFFPSNSSYPGILGELYSAALSAPAFNWICSPAITELETIVLDWLAKIFGLPECYLSKGEGGGVIQGSASEAIVTVMVAARDRYLREKTSHIVDDKEREDAFFSQRSRLVALGSEMAHSSTQKAAQIAGVRFRSVPVTPEEQYAMTGPALEKVIEQCHAENLEPFFLTATLGTTATCAIDDFEGIASLSKSYPSIWIHVDGAYVGAALVCPEYQQYAAHFGAFDSFDMNMHKWLLVNFDASCLFVKNRRHLIDALSITPSYLRNHHSDTGLVIDYRDWQIPLGRRFRSLKIWFVIRTYGVKGLQEYIRNHIRLGREFAKWISTRTDLFSLVSEPAFALTVLAIKPIGSHDQQNLSENRAASNQLTKTIYEAINHQGKIMLTSTMVKDVYAIRVVSGSLKTDRVHLQRAFEILVETTENHR